MARRLLLVFLLIPFLFSCKSRDNIGESYSIDGIYDVDLSSDTRSVLNLWIHHEDYAPQLPVTISVEGLPAGVNVSIEPAAGIPTFATTLLFHNNLSSPPGVYPAKIVATFAEGRKEYDISVTIPVLNDNVWIVDNKVSFVDQAILDTSGGFYPYVNCRSSNGTEFYIRFNSGYTIHKVNATYKIVGAEPTADDEVVISSALGSDGCSSQQFGDTLQLTYDTGFFTVYASNITVLGAGLKKKRMSFRIGNL